MLPSPYRLPYASPFLGAQACPRPSPHPVLPADPPAPLPSRVPGCHFLTLWKFDIRQFHRHRGSNMTHTKSTFRRANLLGSPLSMNTIFISLGNQIQTFTLTFSESPSLLSPHGVSGTCTPPLHSSYSPHVKSLRLLIWATAVLTGVLTHLHISCGVSASIANHPIAAR